MKTIPWLFSQLLITTSLFSQAPVLQESSGWLESAYAEWKPVPGAQSYNVYYTGGGYTNQKIDEPLIRHYGDYIRADIPGLKAGSYTLKIAPVVNGLEGTSVSTPTLNVSAQDRSGFAFSNSQVPGAYQLDGTPKSGAVILYVTENTKNTISMNVTGASTNPCVGIQTILDAYKKGSETRPLLIRLIGNVTDPSYLLAGDLVIENSNKTNVYITLEGIGEDAVVNGWGIRIKNANNIEIKNIAVMNVNSSEGDNIGLQQNNQYIWVHNNDLFYGDAGSDADQIKGDGSLDCKKSTYVTFSYNHFWDNGKSNLLGLSENTTDGLYITYHHNWYDHSDSRHPRVRFYSAHVYNNYYDGIAKYGAGSTLGSSVFMEANYFRNCKYPMLTSMQGTDVFNATTGLNDYEEMPTFSNEDGGTIKAYNNYMQGQKRFVPYGNSSYPNSTVDFDAYVVTSRNTTVPATVKSAYGANTYNNFDVNPSIMYTYTADSPSVAMEKVKTYAGRVSGGDFQWVFNNATDDTAYSVITALKTALVNYQGKIQSIQGESNPVISSSSSVISSSSSSTPISSSSSSSISSSSSSVVVAGDKTHNFTISGTTSSFYSITGNLSSAKGTVIYSNLTLTQCLKMESATQIQFTLDSMSTLTLVFNEIFTGSVLIDGIAYNAVNGIVTATLAEGSHLITKGDASNLFWMNLVSVNGNPVLIQQNKQIQSINDLKWFQLNGRRIHIKPMH